MKTMKEIADAEIRKEWAEEDMEVALAGRAAARALMDRVRLKDLVEDLKLLERLSRRRAYAFKARVEAKTVLPAEEQHALFQKMEEHERSLAERFGFMREKLGWVLEP